MKRGLKREAGDIRGWGAGVEESSPMKRGLKQET